MTELEIVLSDDFRRSVEDNLDRDPMKIALDKRLPHAALVASQVKYLHRSERKLPSYRAAKCIIPPLAFEQSSSEGTASRKNHSGSLCIDLTCGLGVDSFFLSKKFDKVISIERDAELAAIAIENFRRLGADNIEVLNSSSEQFIADFRGEADLVYVDPDRRSAEGKKMVNIEYCSPDIVSLLPRIKEIAPLLIVKLSPLFDVDEVFRVFGRQVRVEVVSLAGECKEVIAQIAENIENPTVRGVAIGIGEAEYPFGDGWNQSDVVFNPERYRWLVVPDVALQKARLAQRYFSDKIDFIESDNSYGFSAEKPENVMGKVFEISRIEPFEPKVLKRRLKEIGVKGVDIMKRNFPLSSADIARQLGVREGGVKAIAFSKIDEKLWQIIL